MASSGRVQSACMGITAPLVRRLITSPRKITNVLLIWQVMHQSALTSTKTVLPAATSSGMAASSKGFHRSPGSASVAAAGAGAPAGRAAGTRNAKPASTTVAAAPARPNRRPARRRTKRAAPAPATNTPTAAAAPRPTCAASTVSSHTPVAARAKPSTRRKVAIHGPGRGSRVASPGTAATAR